MSELFLIKLQASVNLIKHNNAIKSRQTSYLTRNILCIFDINKNEIKSIKTIKMLNINYNIKLTLDQRTVKLSSNVEVQPNTLSHLGNIIGNRVKSIIRNDYIFADFNNYPSRQLHVQS